MPLATKGCSQWCKIVMGTCFSGVPQGTVLGQLLFSLYINDIIVEIESEIRLFADDCVCYRQTDSIETHRNSKRILINWANGRG